MKRSNILRLLGFSCFVGLLYLGVFYFKLKPWRGTPPLIVHLPLILLLVLYYKYRPLVAAISVLTAYLCCQISNWVSINFSYTDPRTVVLLCYPHRCDCDGFLILLLHVSQMQRGSWKNQSLAIWVSFLCLLYFDYATNVYTSLLYSGSKSCRWVFRFCSLHHLSALSLLYFKQYENNKKPCIKTSWWNLCATSLKRSRHPSGATVCFHHATRYAAFSPCHFFHDWKRQKEDALNYIHETSVYFDRMAIQNTAQWTGQYRFICPGRYNKKSRISASNIPYKSQILCHYPMWMWQQFYQWFEENAMHTLYLKLPIEQRVITLHMRMHDEERRSFPSKILVPLYLKSKMACHKAKNLDMVLAPKVSTTYQKKRVKLPICSGWKWLLSCGWLCRG